MASRCVPRLFAVVLTVVSVTACGTTEPVFLQLLQARRLASELRVEFTKASDAANRAVMADTDEASMGAAKEAKQARSIVERDVEALGRFWKPSTIATIFVISMGSQRDSPSTAGSMTKFFHWRPRTRM